MHKLRLHTVNDNAAESLQLRITSFEIGWCDFVRVKKSGASSSSSCQALCHHLPGKAGYVVAFDSCQGIVRLNARELSRKTTDASTRDACLLIAK